MAVNSEVYSSLDHRIVSAKVHLSLCINKKQIENFQDMISPHLAIVILEIDIR